jgi:ketosteroid isomerase-like protein
MRTLNRFGGRAAGVAVAVGVLLLGAGCGRGAGSKAAHAAGEQAIRDLVSRTVAAAGRKDMEQYLRFYGPNAALVLPGLPITYGVGAPRKNGFPPGYAIKMDTAKVEVADSGDLAYAFGTYEQTAPDPKTGSLANSVGKWMCVFRKQPDGTWGAIADTYNVDPPKS